MEDLFVKLPKEHRKAILENYIEFQNFLKLFLLMNKQNIYLKRF